MPQKVQEDEARITLTFKGGLADRNRLPLEQVISTLSEFQALVREVGRSTQAESGRIDADGDFGLELVTSANGIAFRKGSVKADFVATKDTANARVTFRRILAGVKEAEVGKTRQSTPAEQAVVRHMARIAAYQTHAKNNVLLQMSGGQRKQSAQLTSVGYANLHQAQASNLRVELHSIYGRLLGLRDRAQSEESETHFWGTLVADDGEQWRLKFPAAKLKEATLLFRRRVVVEGTAVYFEGGTLRLNVANILLDKERDYVRFFEETTGESFFGDVSREELLKELYA